SRVRKSLRVEIPLVEMLSRSTVRELARLVETRLRDSRTPGVEDIRPVPREARMPLSYAQQRLWVIEQMEPGNGAYNIGMGVRLEGELKVEALRRAVRALVRRHEVLRT